MTDHFCNRLYVQFLVSVVCLGRSRLSINDSTSLYLDVFRQPFNLTSLHHWGGGGGQSDISIFPCQCMVCNFNHHCVLQELIYEDTAGLPCVK